MIIIYPYQPLYISNGVGSELKAVGDDGQELSIFDYNVKYGERGSVVHTSYGEFKYVSAEECSDIIKKLESGIIPEKRKTIFND